MTMLWRLKLRLQIAGAIVSIVSLALIAIKGAAIAYEGLLGVGIAALVLGVLWKNPKPPSST